jgi:cytoskeletal protein CcmA (bactofilin family)
MTGKTIRVIGQVQATGEFTGEFTIEGRIEGQLLCEGGAVVIAATAEVMGDVYARDITVLGRADGQLIATDVVDVRAGATVAGRVMARRLILDEAASFNGRVEPQHLDAAMTVLKYKQKQAAAATGSDSAVPRSAGASL